MSENPGGAFPTTFRFTKTKLQQAIDAVVASGQSQVELCDADQLNFRLLVFKSVKATYGTRYRLRKRRGWKKYGDFRNLHLEQARELHREAMFAVARGEDPNAAQKAKATFAEVSVEFLALGKGKLTTHAENVSKFEKRLNPEFGKLPVATIPTAKLNQFLHHLHSTDGLKPSTVNHYGNLLRTFFDHAIREGYLPAGKNPMDPIKSFLVDNAPTDFMSAQDMADFIASADQDEYRQAALVYVILALTGARLSEWLLAKWSQVSFDRRELRLSVSASENRREATIFLSEAAIEVLRELQHDKRGDYIFSGQRGNAIMARPGRATRRRHEPTSGAT